MKKLINMIYLLSVFENEMITQATKCFIVGGFCVVLNFGMLSLLTHFAGLDYVSSSVIAFMSSSVLNYYSYIFWIFEIRLVENHYCEFFYYAIITAIGLGTNTFFIRSFTKLFGLYFMLSNFLATFVTYLWNFGARKYFLHTIR